MSMIFTRAPYSSRVDCNSPHPVHKNKHARIAGMIEESFARLLGVVKELREQCPWDREQKLGDTPRHLIEEAYEVGDAITGGNPADVAEELGDVIVQCFFTGVILAEDAKIDLATVMQNAAEKLIRRHPHVYGNTRAETAAKVVENWD